MNAISPGIIDSPGARRLLGEEGSDVRARFIDGLLIRRIGQVSDVVNAAVFLDSDESSFITGTQLSVDGGWQASGGLGRTRQDTFDALATLAPPRPLRADLVIAALVVETSTI